MSPEDHVALEGYAYHNDCLPRRAQFDKEKGEVIVKSSPTIRKKTTGMRIYEALERRAADGKINNLEQVLIEIALEMNVNRGWIEYYLRQLDTAGYVHRVFNSLTLVKPPVFEQKEG